MKIPLLGSKVWNLYGEAIFHGLCGKLPFLLDETIPGSNVVGMHAVSSSKKLHIGTKPDL